MKNRIAWLGLACWMFVVGIAPGADTPPPLEKPGWKLTFHDEFDRPQLNDMYWFPAYRSGRKEYFKRIGHESRWVDHNAHYVIEDGVLKLRVDERLPFRPDKSTPCVSCIQTSDHRFGATTEEYQILDKFAQKYGWFEIRCKCGARVCSTPFGCTSIIRSSRSTRPRGKGSRLPTAWWRSISSSSRDG